MPPFSRIALAADCGHDAGFGQGFGGGEFHLQPGAELVFVTPDVSHLRAGITCDQASSLMTCNLVKETYHCNCWHKVRVSHLE